MDIRIGYVDINCGVCGNPYEAMVIDGHITYPHICDNCIRDIIKEWDEQENKNDSI